MRNSESAGLFDRLYRQLAEAETEFYRAREKADRAFLDSLGTPLADGQYHRAKLSAEARNAYEKYERAMERFRAFVDEGIVPEDV